MHASRGKYIRAEPISALFEQNRVHLVGNFPTQPLQIQYELLFLQLDGIWRLDGIAIDAVPTGTAQASAAHNAGDASKAKGNRISR